MDNTFSIQSIADLIGFGRPRKERRRIRKRDRRFCNRTSNDIVKYLRNVKRLLNKVTSPGVQQFLELLKAKSNEQGIDSLLPPGSYVFEVIEFLLELDSRLDDISELYDVSSAKSAIGSIGFSLLSLVKDVSEKDKIVFQFLFRKVPEECAGDPDFILSTLPTTLKRLEALLGEDDENIKQCKKSLKKLENELSEFSKKTVLSKVLTSMTDWIVLEEEEKAYYAISTLFYLARLAKELAGE